MKGFFASIALFAVLVSGAFAKQDQGAYKLRAEDILHIQIYNEPQVNSEVPVGRDGNIAAPFVGTVKAEGRTITELSTELTAKFKEILRLKNPQVSITVTRFRPLLATVGGAVLHPGTVEFRYGDRVLSLFTKGGGASQDSADLRRVTLRRADSLELIPIDILALQAGTDTSQDYVLEDGDVLMVPENRRNRVLVQGIVQKPGFFVFREPMRLADALSLAGGEVPTRSKLSQVQILRELPGLIGQYLRIQVDYVAFIRKNDFSQNIELQPGDIIYVPETNTPDLSRIGNFVNSYFIFQDVIRRGIFGIKL